MNSIAEVRQVIFSTFKALHEASYPTMPVSWPNFSTIDGEALTGSFVSVQLSFRGSGDAYDITASEDIIKGEVLISFLRPAGSGLIGAGAYADMLRGSMCHREVSGITYFGCSILEVSPAPGIVGQMFVIPFQII